MHAARRRGFHHGIAAVVCSLLLFFAVGAKVAAYHTSEQAARPIASAKMWQTSKSAPVEDEKAAIAQPLILILLVSGLLFTGELLVYGRHCAVQGQTSRDFPPLAVRPPPAI